MYSPVGRSNANEPSVAVVARATSPPVGAVTTMTASGIARGAQFGSGGTVSTGHVGPAVTCPVTWAFGTGEAPVEQPSTTASSIPNEISQPTCHFPRPSGPFIVTCLPTAAGLDWFHPMLR